MNLSKLSLQLFLLLAVVLVLIPCLQQGMFLDGVNYANVANNLANGKGSIWHFTYSETFLSHYTHQLPFMLWCEGLLFYIFGDSLIIERLFCLALLALNAHGLAVLWKTAFPDYSDHHGFPLVLWIITPIVFWGFANNVQELMMSLCSVWSIAALLKYFGTSDRTWLLLGGLFCFLGAFCKGVQGLFPLIAIPLHHFIVNKRAAIKVIQDQFIFTVPILLSSVLLWIYLPARQMLIDNFESRLRSTFVEKVQDTTSNRFDLWFDLGAELLVPIGLCVLLYFLATRSKKRLSFSWNKHSLYLFAIGLSGSLPLIATLEQRRFYLITSIPFFVLAIAGVFVPFLYSVKVKKSVYKGVSWLLSITTIVAFVYAIGSSNSYKRDQAMLEDVDAIGAVVEARTINADPELVYHYPLLAYLARLYNVSLDFEGNQDNGYYLSTKGNTKNSQQTTISYNGNLYVLTKMRVEK